MDHHHTHSSISRQEYHEYNRRPANKTFVENKGALQFVKAVLVIATQIDFDMNYKPQKCFTELKRRRAIIRNGHQALRDSDHLPCGMQDAIGEQLDAACWNFNAYLAAMRICRGEMPKTILEHWNRAIGND